MRLVEQVTPGTRCGSGPVLFRRDDRQRYALRRTLTMPPSGECRTREPPALNGLTSAERAATLLWFLDTNAVDRQRYTVVNRLRRLRDKR